MKKITIAFLFAAFILNAKAQLITINNVAKFNLPIGAILRLPTDAEKKYTKRTDNRLYYSYRGLLVGIYSYATLPEWVAKETLEKKKKEFGSLFINTSSDMVLLYNNIETINGNRFLILNTKDGNSYNLSCSSSFHNNDSINFSISYKQADDALAQQALRQMAASVVFVN